MAPSTNLKPVLDFLSELKQHNNRLWFENNRAAYEQARAQFEAFVERLIEGFSAFEELSGVTARDSALRIYRDIRFSKDKSPYRTNMSADITPGGRKSGRLGYYIHVAPHGETFLGGGLYMPDPQHLARFRAGIDRDASRFKAIVNDKEFKKHLGMLVGEKLKTAPQGYSQDHPEIEMLRMKQIMAVRQWSDEAVLSSRFPSQVVASARALKPFLDYLNGVISR